MCGVEACVPLQYVDPSRVPKYQNTNCNPSLSQFLIKPSRSLLRIQLEKITEDSFFLSLSLSIYIYIFRRIYIYIHVERERERERQTDRQTDRERHRQNKRRERETAPFASTQKKPSIPPRTNNARWQELRLGRTQSPCLGGACRAL